MAVRAQSSISQRGQSADGLLPSYLSDARQVTCYCPKTAPEGALQLGVAESYLMPDWLHAALNNIRPSIPTDAIYYQPTQGRADFVEAMASYVEELLKLPSQRLQRDNLVVGAGCNAVLENLCTVLADVGDAVLVPTPYYAAFEFDLGARAGLSVVSVTTAAYSLPSLNNDPAAQYYPTAKALDAGYQMALQQGSSPRILLLSHPHNPLGIVWFEQIGGN